MSLKLLAQRNIVRVMGVAVKVYLIDIFNNTVKSVRV